MTTITLPDLPAGLIEQVAIVTGKRDAREVAGLTVAPGLIVTAAYRHVGYGQDQVPVRRRYRLNHGPTGLHIPTGTHCANHLQEVVAALVGTGVDWAQDKEALLAAKDKFAEVAVSFRHLCDNDYYGCPGDPDPWHIRCNTCDWEYDPEDGDIGDGVPTSAKEALQIADGHGCEPWIEIKAPGTDQWGPPYAFADKAVAS